MNTTPVARIKQLLRTRTQKQLAAELEVSTSYLNDVLHGRREAGESMLDALGLSKRVTYVEAPK